MEIIPVIDVRGGVAVRAVAGDRANYRPLETRLARGSDPVAIALGYAALFPFRTFYVADLDGIEGRGRDEALSPRLADALPNAEFWIDDGRAQVEDGDVGSPPTLALPTRGREPVASKLDDGVPPPLWGRLGGGETQSSLSEGELRAHLLRRQVIGSESLVSPSLRWRGEGQQHVKVPAAAPHVSAEPSSARTPLPMKDGERAWSRWVLSLDFRDDAFVGPQEILDRDDLWPERIIVMTLARVGVGAGPDVMRVAEIVRRAQARRVYAAGGVRDLADLRALNDAGAAGALVATALHTGQIKTGDLREIAGL